MKRNDKRGWREKEREDHPLSHSFKSLNYPITFNDHAIMRSPPSPPFSIWALSRSTMNNTFTVMRPSHSGGLRCADRESRDATKLQSLVKPQISIPVVSPSSSSFSGTFTQTHVFESYLIHMNELRG